jgi:hypothetical protein
MLLIFAGTYTPANLRHALAIRRKALPNPNILLFWLTIFAFVLILMVGLILNPARLWATLVFVAILLLLQIPSSRLSPFLALEEWRGAPHLHLPQQGTITDEGIEVRHQQGMSHSQWAGYAYQVITPDMILLFQGVTTFQFYPRSFFATDADWQAFTDLVQQRISADPPAIWRPIFARLNTLWIFALFLTLFVGVAVVFSI